MWKSGYVDMLSQKWYQIDTKNGRMLESLPLHVPDKLWPALSSCQLVGDSNLIGGGDHGSTRQINTELHIVETH